MSRREAGGQAIGSNALFYASEPLFAPPRLACLTA